MITLTTNFARILALDHYHHRFSAQGAWQGSRWQAPERGGVRLPRQAEAGGTSHRHPVSGPRGCCALPPHFPRCSLGAFRLSPVRSDARVPSLPQLWVP